MSKAKEWMPDSRGQRIPLRPDPEGIWKHGRSFRPNFTSGKRLLREHPRIAVVIAMREVPKLVFKPSREERSRFIARETTRAVTLAAIIYGGLLAGMFGYSNWLVIPVILLLSIGIVFGGDWLTWARNRRRLEEIRDLLAEHPLYCPGCWYPLDDRVDPDGCTVCPECGAAWRLNG